MNSYPTNVGRYVVQAEVGRGSMSAVYRAYDPLFERHVALKFLLPNLQNAQQVHQRFLQEARVIAALDHPGIVPVYDFAEYDEFPYLVMRLMPNGSLAERLRSGGVSLQEMVHIINCLAPALDEAHRQGVVHRDLKPSNILFDQRDKPFLSDFGIAKLIGNDKRLTNTGYLVGTPAYMSPEQIEGRSDLDGRSDIYSLGVLCYEMLTGQLPFETDTPFSLAVKHILDPVPDIGEHRPDLPPVCQMIIDKAMAKNREERYETAVSLANALQTLLDAEAGEIHLADDTIRTLLVQDSPHNPHEKLAVVILDSQEQPDLLAKVTVEAPIPPFPKTLSGTDDMETLVNEIVPVVKPKQRQFSARKRRLISTLVSCALLALFIWESGNVLSNNMVMAPTQETAATEDMPIESQERSIEMSPPRAILSRPGATGLQETDLGSVERRQLQRLEYDRLAIPQPALERGAEECGSSCQPDEEPERSDSMMKLQIKQVVVKYTNDQTAH